MKEVKNTTHLNFASTKYAKIKNLILIKLYQNLTDLSRICFPKINDYEVKLYRKTKDISKNITKDKLKDIYFL